MKDINPCSPKCFGNTKQYLEKRSLRESEIMSNAISINLERSEFKDTAFRRYSPEDIGILEAECKRLLKEGFIKEATAIALTSHLLS